uniref:Uncharacterized protein n=1 Tax=Plectus sambesii TaxID=2011161 RepID=A0A914V6W3_9BILA
MRLNELRNVFERKTISLEVKSSSPNPSTRASSRQSRIVVSDLETTREDSKWKKHHPWVEHQPRRASEPSATARVIAFYPSVKRRNTIVQAHGKLSQKPLGEIPTIPSKRAGGSCCAVQ